MSHSNHVFGAADPGRDPGASPSPSFSRRGALGLALAGAGALALPPGAARAAGSLPAGALPRRFAATARELVSGALASNGAYRELVELVTRTPHRLSGSEGLERAIEWAAERARALGADEVRLQPVRVPHWERGSLERVELRGPRAVAGEALTCLALGGSDPTPEGGLTGRVLEVRDFDELLQRSADARGRIVFFSRPFPAERPDTFSGYGATVNQRVQGAVEAAKAGAIAVLVRSIGTHYGDYAHTGAMRYQPGVPRIPAASLSVQAAERLSALLAAEDEGEPVQVHLALDCRWRGEALSHNVIADVRGREHPEEIVLVGAHIDGWDVGQGAHDDGTGCGQCLEVVRLFAALAERPRRTLRMVLFTNEENGQAGGLAYHREHLEDMPHHVLALESDRGGFAPRGFTTNAADAGFAILKELCAELDFASAGELRVGGGGADIGPMAASGVPLVGFLPDSQRYFDLHHSHRDTLAQVSHREVNLGAGAIAALLWGVAEREERFPANL